MVQGNPKDSLLTEEIMAALIENGRQGEAASRVDKEFNPLPVVKLFTPDAGTTWLLSEADPSEPDQVFGLCDLGFGCAELGWSSLQEIENLRGSQGLPVERDIYFVATKSISAYASDADAAGRITT